MKKSKDINLHNLMQKRILLVLIAFFMVSSLMGAVPVKAEDNDFHIIAAEKLEALGVLETGISFEEVISRGEFAKRIIDIYGPSLSVEQNFHYTDVSGGNKYFAAIGAVSAMKLMLGYEDGSFLPNREITVGEAIKVFVCQLGYEALAQNRGGYPSGYLTYASRIGLLKDFSYSTNSPLTGKDFVILLNNVIDAGVMEPTTLGSTNKYEVDESITLLSKYHNIYKDEGIVNATDVTSLTGEFVLTSGKVSVSDNVYLAGNTDAAKMLGHNVEFYYKENDGENTIMYISSVDTTVLKVDAENLMKFSGSRLVYDDGGKEEEISISSQIDCIYNGKAMIPFDNSDLMISSGVLTFIDNDSDDVCDVVLIDSVFNYVVGTVDIDNELVYDKYSGRTVDLDKMSKGLDIINSEGKIVTIPELTEWDLLCVKTAKDGTITEIIVALDEIEGVVTQITDDNVVIGEESYKIAQNYKDYGKEFKVGLTAVFYLDIEGRIAFFREDLAFKNKYAYLAGVSETDVFDKRLELCLFTSKGEFLNAYSAKNIIIDGENIKNVANPAAYLNDVKGVVVYKLNENGEVSSLDTMTKGSSESEYSLNRYYSGYFDDAGNTLGTPEQLTFRTKSAIFGGKACVENNTVIFNVPMSDLSDYDRYDILTIDKLADEKKYVVESYKTDPDSHFAEVVTIDTGNYQESSIAASSPMALVKKITTALTDDGETATKLSLSNSRGVDSEVYVKETSLLNAAYGETGGETAYSITLGDLIRYSTDSKGYINKITVIYDVESDTLCSTTSSSVYMAKARMVSGYIASVDRGNMMLCYTLPSVFDAATDKYEYYKATLFKIHVCDLSSGKAELRVGTTADLISSDNVKVVLQSFYGNSGAIVVYKK